MSSGTRELLLAPTPTLTVSLTLTLTLTLTLASYEIADIHVDRGTREAMEKQSNAER